MLTRLVMSDSVIPWTEAYQAPLSMHWTVLPFPTPGDLPDPGIELAFPAPPALADRFFTTVSPGNYIYTYMYICMYNYIFINMCVYIPI